LLATVVGASTTASTTYLHLDHLGGTNVTTDEDWEVTQTLDYYPYGSQRTASGSFDEQRKFTGHEHDGENDLTYANARYYEHDLGKWLSQDPASRDTPEQFLNDPQQLNNYAYARNNPLRFLDQSGEVTIEFSRPVQNRWIGWGASHNAIAGYNVPGFPDGIITIAGYDTGGFPIGNTLITHIGRAADGSLASYDYETAERIFAGDSSGVRGVTLIKDFGGLTEEVYWKRLLEGAAMINEDPKSYNSLTRNSHSALNSIKNYANAGSSAYQPTWHLTPAARVGVLPGSSSSSGSYRSASSFGLSADTQISADNARAFASFISQFLE
jgi:RHS repeat-associated protein